MELLKRRLQDSNSQHPVLETGALPIELNLLVRQYNKINADDKNRTRNLLITNQLHRQEC